MLVAQDLAALIRHERHVAAGRDLDGGVGLLLDAQHDPVGVEPSARGRQAGRPLRDAPAGARVRDLLALHPDLGRERRGQ